MESITLLNSLSKLDCSKLISEAFVESGEEGEVPEFEIDPYQEITFNAGYGMRTTLQSVVDAGLLSRLEVKRHYYVTLT